MTNAAARDRFSRVVQPRLGEAFRLARLLTGNSADAEDVVQEASLRAYKAIEGYTEGNARAWFLTIVRNVCYSWMTSNRSRPLVHSDDLSVEDLIIWERGGAAALPSQTPESELITKDDADQLTKAIEALPLPLKECLILREYELP